jgi:hypothetical protein
VRDAFRDRDAAGLRALRDAAAGALRAAGEDPTARPA